MPLKVGQKIKRVDLINQLIFIQYIRNDVEKASGTFQVIGNTIEINFPIKKKNYVLSFLVIPLNVCNGLISIIIMCYMELDNTLIFPAKHFVTTQEKKDAAIESITR